MYLLGVNTKCQIFFFEQRKKAGNNLPFFVNCK